MPTVLDEVIEKVPSLTSQERHALIKLLEIEEQKSVVTTNPNLDIEWLKKHRKEFAGNHVALNNGKLIAVGKTFKEVHLKAKEICIEKPFFHYIPAEDEIVWGGW